MNKNVKSIMVVSILGGIAFLGWRLLNPGKQRKVNFLVKNNFTSASTLELMTRGDDYISEWYKSAKGGKKTFKLDSGTYNTEGGKAV